MVTRHIRLVVLALVVAAAGVGLPAVAAQPGPSSTTTTASNASADAVAPGAQLAGALGAQGANVEGAVEHRAFDHALASMQSNASRARFIASRQASLHARVDAFADRRAALVAAHRNGTLSDGAFAARMATLAARSQSASRLAERTGDAAAALPASVRASHGIDLETLGALRARADEVANLTGTPAAAAVVGTGPPGVAPHSPLPTPGEANATLALERATHAVERLGVAVNATPTADADARDSLRRARATLADARAARETGNATRAARLAARAATTAETARSSVNASTGVDVGTQTDVATTAVETDGNATSRLTTALTDGSSAGDAVGDAVNGTANETTNATLDGALDSAVGATRNGTLDGASANATA